MCSVVSLLWPWRELKVLSLKCLGVIEDKGKNSETYVREEECRKEVVVASEHDAVL